MLEESSMEKNILNRVAQPSIKGSSSDSKKNQDGSKSFPRGSKRREPPGPSTSKFDQNRKPAPQKSKSFDKRPRSKGQPTTGRKTSTEVADDYYGAEYGSVVKRESKKHNLNHLLNFHYAPRPGEQWGGFGMGSRNQQHHGYMTTRTLMATSKHKYNKEQFLQANCQFVVRADGDYAIYLADPDTLVNWELVEQIRMPVTDEINCPICLFHPVAAKMTRCGHIYCWSCILHYLALSDKTWRKCPICYEAVHKGDLKSVTSLPRSFCAVGEPITLKLMKRAKGSMQCAPATQFDAYNFEKPLPVTEKQLDITYAKLLVADNNEVLNIVEVEEKQLLNQLKEDEGCPELCFVEQALEAVKERKIALLKLLGKEVEVPSAVEENIINDNLSSKDQCDSLTVANSNETVFDNLDASMKVAPDVNENLECEAPEACLPQLESANIEGSDNRTRYESMSSEGGEEGVEPVKDYFSPEDLEFHAAPTKNNQQSDHYYFYQASDGQQVFLHAINTRMLEMNFGSLENCPREITGRVLEKESGSMTEELRKRLRYLQHLPLTCQFEVVEINLDSLVSKEVMETFKDQLEGRERRRTKRAREERKREKKIEENEKKMYGQFQDIPRRRIRLDSYQHFPECGINDASFMPIRSEESVGGSARSISPITAAVASVSLEDVNRDPNSMSFAQMLRDGKSFSGASNLPKSPNAWPSISKRNRNNNRTSMDFPVVGSSPPSRPSLSETVHIFCQSSAQGISDVDGATSIVKKKKKKQILFSTGI